MTAFQPIFKGGLRKLSTRIVYQNVEPAEMIAHAIDEILYLFRIPDGHGTSQHLPAKATQELCGFFELFLVPPVDGQISPETGEQGGNRQAQPASRAGHDNGFSREQPINIDRWIIAQSFTGKPVTGFRH